MNHDHIAVDEQGDWFPPGAALAAFLVGWANEPELDGTLVEVGAFLPEHDVFEVLPLNTVFIGGVPQFPAQEPLFAYARELRPINKATQKYIAGVTETKVEMYDMDVYDLRDKLDGIGIAVTAESIAKWSGAQRSKVWIYAVAVADGEKELPKRPEVLL